MYDVFSKLTHILIVHYYIFKYAKATLYSFKQKQFVVPLNTTEFVKPSQDDPIK